MTRCIYDTPCVLLVYIMSVRAAFYFQRSAWGYYDRESLVNDAFSGVGGVTVAWERLSRLFFVDQAATFLGAPYNTIAQHFAQDTRGGCPILSYLPLYIGKPKNRNHQIVLPFVSNVFKVVLFLSYSGFESLYKERGQKSCECKAYSVPILRITA